MAVAPLPLRPNGRLRGCRPASPLLTRKTECLQSAQDIASCLLRESGHRGWHHEKAPFALRHRRRTESARRAVAACSEATIGDLRDALYPDGGGSKFATVQTLLARLADKGLVRRRKDGANWIFAPLVTRDELIGGELLRMAERLGGSSRTPLLTYLVETGQLTAKERAHSAGCSTSHPPAGANRAAKPDAVF